MSYPRFQGDEGKHGHAPARLGPSGRRHYRDSKTFMAAVVKRAPAISAMGFQLDRNGSP